MTETAQAPVPPAAVSALILAAGQGLRIGDGPKAFLRFGGQSLLERVATQVGRFAEEVIAALPPEAVEAGKRHLSAGAAQIVAGGETRQDTVAILCRHATRPLVLVQDVARPFTPDDHLATALRLGQERGGAITTRPGPQRDGVALRDGDRYGPSLPRDDVIRTQTPQVYRREVLLEAMARAEREGWEEISPAALVTRSGYPVALLECPTDNLKITFPGDLEVARRDLGPEG